MWLWREQRRTHGPVGEDLLIECLNATSAKALFKRLKALAGVQSAIDDYKPGRKVKWCYYALRDPSQARAPVPGRTKGAVHPGRVPEVQDEDAEPDPGDEAGRVG